MIACLLVPSPGLACALAERPALRGRPLALSDEAGLRVLDATAEAAARGVRSGMTLREAAAFCPPLAVAEPRPARLARLLDRLRAALEAVSPLVETPALDALLDPLARDPAQRDAALYADLRGTHALHPTPGHLARAILAALSSTLEGDTGTSDPLARSAGEGDEGQAAPWAEARLGLAGHRFTALAAARSLASPAPGPPDDVRDGMRVVFPDEAAAFLAPLPAAWLPLPVEALDHLRLLGIRTMGDLAALPYHAVQAQLGRPGARAWLAARGADPTPVRPGALPGERVVERTRAEPPLVGRESVLAAARQLLGRALGHRRVRRRSVRTIRLRAVTEDDRLWEHTHTLKEPTGDHARLWTAVRTQLERAAYPGAVAEVEIEVGGLTAEHGRQPSLLHAERTRRREQLDEMVRHLQARYGHSPLARIVPVEPWSRFPERRYALLEYDP